MNKIKFAIVGCGRISKNHVTALINSADNADLVAVCDLIEDRANQRKSQYEEAIESTVKVYTDYNDMFKNEDIDVVVISTESGNHYQVAIDALNNGSNILIEKPMCMKLEEADEVIKLAEEKNLKISVSHQNRFNPAIQKLRKAVEEGRFGRIMSVTARILWTRDQNYYDMAPWRGTVLQDGGTLMNQCIHNIDLLQWMTGSTIKRVKAERARYKRNIEMEDFGAAVLRFENGSIGIIEGSAVVYPSNLEETLSVFGEKGTVVIGGKAVNEIKTWLFEDEKDYDKIDSEDIIENVYGNGHTYLYKDFINAINEDKDPYIDGKEGRKPLEIILKIYEESNIEQ